MPINITVKIRTYYLQILIHIYKFIYIWTFKLEYIKNKSIHTKASAQSVEYVCDSKIVNNPETILMPLFVLSRKHYYYC